MCDVLPGILVIACFALSISASAQNDGFESSMIKPRVIVRVSDTHYFIDFGKAFFGTIWIRSKKQQGDSLIIHLGEKLSSKHVIDRNPGGTIRYQRNALPYLEANTPVLLSLRPDKRNTSPPAIALPDRPGVVMPFRYCEIENLKIPIGDIEIVQKAFHYTFHDRASSFTSSDTVLNALWDLCKHTIKASSFAGVYVDGDRERIPYEADAFINQLSHYSVDSVYSIARKTNEYFINHPTWPTEWQLHTVMLFYYDYWYTGDVTALEKHYEVLKKKTLMGLAREDGLISTHSEKVNDEFMGQLGFENQKARLNDIVDWPPAQKDTGWKLATAEGERDGYELVAINTVVNSFYYRNLVIMEEIAGVLGKKEDSVAYMKESIRVKNTVNDKLFDKKRGVYRDGENSDHASLHANMLPLAFDLVPEEYVSSVLKFIQSRGMACSVYGAQYLLDGLYRQHQSKYAFQLMVDTSHDRTWWNMIKQGSTMTWEAWDVKYKPNLDWNHAWGTAPLNIITRYMWGITPARPGFTKVTVAPQLDELEFSVIDVPTGKGVIHAEYKRHKNGSGSYTIHLPDNMDGEFVIHRPGVNVYLNKQRVDSKRGVVRLRPGKNIIELKTQP